MGKKLSLSSDGTELVYSRWLWKVESDPQGGAVVKRYLAGRKIMTTKCDTLADAKTLLKNTYDNLKKSA